MQPEETVAGAHSPRGLDTVMFQCAVIQLQNCRFALGMMSDADRPLHSVPQGVQKDFLKGLSLRGPTGQAPSSGLDAVPLLGHCLLTELLGDTGPANPGSARHLVS